MLDDKCAESLIRGMQISNKLRSDLQSAWYKRGQALCVTCAIVHLGRQLRATLYPSGPQCACAQQLGRSHKFGQSLAIPAPSIVPFRHATTRHAPERPATWYLVPVCFVPPCHAVPRETKAKPHPPSCTVMHRRPNMHAQTYTVVHPYKAGRLTSSSCARCYPTDGLGLAHYAFGPSVRPSDASFVARKVAQMGMGTETPRLTVGGDGRAGSSGCSCIRRVRRGSPAPRRRVGMVSREVYASICLDLICICPWDWDWEWGGSDSI